MIKSALLVFLICLGSCYKVSDKIEPRVSYEIQQRHFETLQSAFPPLSHSERQTDWGKEMVIAHAFARDLDLYRAASTYRRAQILIPEDLAERKSEIEYDIFLCYYLGKRYEDAIDSFCKSSLASVDKTFPAYHDLLLILYECYQEVAEPEKEQKIRDLLQKSFPETAEKLSVSLALRTGDLQQTKAINEGLPRPSYLDPLLDCYEQHKKSVRRAQMLNAVLPGAGYFYIGQKKSALTAFFLNGLFIAAACQFFHRGNIAAGVIATGFETGWYFGGIYGAGEEAKYYNEHLYETQAARTLCEENLFPVLMLRHAF